MFENNPRLIPLNNKPQAQKVYSSDGLATTLCANGGGQGGKTGLYKVDKQEPHIEVVGNVSNTNHWGEIVEYPKLDDETIMLKNNTKKGYLPAKEGDGVVLDFANAKGRVQQQSSPTMTAHSNIGTVTKDLYVRRLTPLECERLQGFPDNWTQYGANGDHISDTQRYKCIGNAVTTNVVQYIIEEWEMKV